jgi:hypothetical protein
MIRVFGLSGSPGMRSGAARTVATSGVETALLLDSSAGRDRSRLPQKHFRYGAGFNNYGAFS